MDKFKIYQREKRRLERAKLSKRLSFLKEEAQKLIKKNLWDIADYRKGYFLQGELQEFVGSEHIRGKNNKEIIKILKELGNRPSFYGRQAEDNYFLRYEKRSFDDATEDSDEALFRLISYDKSYLFDIPGYNDDVRFRILKAQAFGEDWFLDRLGDAIKKDVLRFPKKIKKSSIWLKDFLLSLKLNLYFDFNRKSDFELMYENLWERLSKERTELEDIKPQNSLHKKRVQAIDKIFTIIEDENYFRYKWLRRHGLIKDTKK